MVMKPIIAAIADIFPSSRRSLFIMTLVFMVVSFSSINFVSPMHGIPKMQGQLVGNLQGTGDHPTTPSVSMVVEKLEDKSHDVVSLMLAAMDDGEYAWTL